MKLSLASQIQANSLCKNDFFKFPISTSPVDKNWLKICNSSK